MSDITSGSNNNNTTINTEISSSDVLNSGGYGSAEFTGRLRAYGNGIKNSNNGFYYDIQLRNELTCVTLHPNTELDDSGKWVDISGATDSDFYSIKPLCRAILSEDFQVAASNTWSEFGDDAIGSTFNSFKPYAPYLSKISSLLSNANEGNIEEGNNDSSFKSSFAKVMNTVKNTLIKVTDEGANLLNRTLVAQGARFSYYSGTGIGFGNLVMKFTVFADWKPTESSNVDADQNNYSQENMTSETEFVSVKDQLEKLYPYIMGRYERGILDKNGNITNTSISTGLNEGQVNKVNEYTAWEYPPAGYKPDTKNVDNIQFGTLKLKFGAFYSIPSLVCSSAQFQSSKQMVKYWEGGRNKLSPLYCDVILTLQPSTKFSDNTLRNFIKGQSMIQETSSIQMALKDVLNKKIEENNRLLAINR